MNENLAANRSKDAFRKEEASYRFDDTKTATYRNPQESKNTVVPGKVLKKSRNQLLLKKKLQKYSLNALFRLLCKRQKNIQSNLMEDRDTPMIDIK